MPLPTRDRVAGWSPRKRAVLGAAVFVAVVAVDVVYTLHLAQRHNYIDLRIYAGAVHQWWHGGELYGFGLLDDGRTWGFTYPPFAAFIMAPMAWLPWSAISVLQAVGSAVATVLILALVLRQTARRLGWWLPAMVAVADVLLVPFEPWSSTMSYGQVNVLLLGLVALDLLWAVPRRHLLAGVCVGVATAVKLTPAIFIAYLLIVRERRAALTAAGTASFVTVASAALAPHESFDFWTKEIFDIQRIGEPSWIDNQSLNGTLHRVSPHAATVLWGVLALLVFVFWLWRVRQTKDDNDRLAGFALTAVASCLISPVTWVYHLVWLIPALAVLVDRVATREAPARRRRIALAVLLGAYALLCSHLEWRPGHGVLGFLTGNVDVFVSLGLLVALPLLRQPEWVPAPVVGRASVPMSLY